jgi:hypothetical protein
MTALGTQVDYPNCEYLSPVKPGSLESFHKAWPAETNVNLVKGCSERSISRRAEIVKFCPPCHLSTFRPTDETICQHSSKNLAGQSEATLKSHLEDSVSLSIIVQYNRTPRARAIQLFLSSTFTLLSVFRTIQGRGVYLGICEILNNTPFDRALEFLSARGRCWLNERVKRGAD